MRKKFRKEWGFFGLSAILLFIIFVNFKPGFVILGNDNFSPELNPAMSVTRSIFSPAWRTYRVLGIPSDSEQADVFRSSLFTVLETVFPAWLVSQAYLFFTFFIASFSMGMVTRYFVMRIFGEEKEQSGFFFGGLFYLSSMLTSWIYFFPVQLFVAAYAFLPLVLWRVISLFEHRSAKNACWLLIASLFLATAALTTTMFITLSLVIVCFLGVLWYEEKHHHKAHRFQTLVVSLMLIFGIQLFWALPFLTYAISNTKALRESAINREITATTIENEARYNTAENAIRFYSSWMDTKEDKKTYTFPYRDFYKENLLAGLLSFVPAIFFLYGAFFLSKKKHHAVFSLFFLAAIGWYFIKGINEPFGFIYAFVQNAFPVAAQVFRWQSSKLWPFLGVTIPVLATVGFLHLLALFAHKKKEVSVELPVSVEGKPTYFKAHVSFGFLSTLLFVAVTGGLLLFVYPYFTGHLLRESVFVQVPDEYSDLAKYLVKTDPTSRIYLAPEANTLYFRNYDFGFWGSVLLHYIIPNPIIEKALIIGSFENEQAFTVLHGAYYSEKADVFISALKRYDTPYVLSDRHASTGAAGYAYNWNVQKAVVETNPDLEKVWEEGGLTLYKVKDYQKLSSQKAVRIYPETNFTKLNTILSGVKVDTAYYTDGKKTGFIFPFATEFDSISISADSLTATKTYRQDPEIYTLTVLPGQFLESPSQVFSSLDTQSILFSPLMPTFAVGSITYQYQKPSLVFSVKENPTFVSVGQQVVDLRSPSAIKTVDAKFSDLVEQGLVHAWGGVFQPFNVLIERQGAGQIFVCSDGTFGFNMHVFVGQQTKCVTPALTIAKDSIIETEFRVKTSNPVRVNLCLESQNKKSCLNKNTTMFIDTVGETSLLIPTVVDASDSIKVYVTTDTTSENDAQVTVEKLLVKSYQEDRSLTPSAQTSVITPQVVTIPLKPNDTLTMTVPLLSGENSSPLRSDGVLIPESTVSPFDRTNPQKSTITISAEKGLNIVNTESSSSVFPKLQFLEPVGGIAFVGYSGENSQGIPSEISVRDTNQPYKLWSQRLYPKKATEDFNLFLMPDAVRSYYFETFSTGLGPRASENTMKALSLEVIPLSWASMQLVPSRVTALPLTQLSQDGKIDADTYSGAVSGGNLAAISQAVSPNFVLHLDNNTGGQAVRINGWMQGWNVSDGGNAVVTFWPNLLVYLGFAPLIIAVFWIVVKAVEEFILAKIK